MRRYAAEFIGTFFLVFVVCAAVYQRAPLAPLAIGATLMVMIFAGGHISGGHFNPAVTLAVFIRGRIPAGEVAPYWVAQIVGAVVAAVAAHYVVNPDNQPGLSLSGRAIGAALLAEFLFTFALAYVALNVATSKDHPNNSFYGLAIGFTMLAGEVAVGGISGGAFNPALALGAATGGIVSWGSVWVLLLADLIGGAAAGYAFKALNPEDA